MTNNSKVLALKYRPQVFDDLIGQEIIVDTLKKSISFNKIPNAFLFTGIRGIGKTTIARVLAKSLNCSKGQNFSCNNDCCNNGVEISESRNIDVLEIDAASRTGVDDVRELIEFSRYGPTSSKYKIFIIDEVHMLSKQAFNALLKTLEEPPNYLKFIFATTEVNKIPITVLSRCQRFDLSRIKSQDMLQFLIKVSGKERILANTEVLKLISKISEGSVRDALSLLDRISLSRLDSNEKEFTLEDAQKIFGYFDKSILIDLIESIFNGDEKKSLDIYRNIYSQGVDPKVFLNNFIEIIYYIKNFENLRNIDSSINLNEDSINKLENLFKKVDPKTLIMFWQFSIEIMDEINIVFDQNLSVEMFLIRLLYLNGMIDEQTENRKPVNQPFSKDQTKDNKENIKNSIVNQLKSSTQKKENKLEQGQNLNDLNINSFADLVEICTVKKEAELKYELENNVNLVSFKKGYIEISFNNNLKKEFVKTLSSKLYDWTKERWILTLSQKKGQDTLKKNRAIKKEMDFEKLKKSEIYDTIKKSFSDAELIDIKSEKNE